MMKTVNLHYQILHLVLLTLKRTEIFGGAYLEWGAGRNAPLLLSKIINAVTFKLSKKVAHLKYFKNIS